MRPPKPRITKKHLKWTFNTRKNIWEPYHRVTWTEGGKRKERAIKLDWQGDPQRLDDLYWTCESGRHENQAAPASKHTWRIAIIEWRSDKHVQSKLAAGTKRFYRKPMDRIVEKNGDKEMGHTTRKGVRAAHQQLADTPREADKHLQAASMVWNYAKRELDWPLGDNPVAGIKLFGKQREFLPWPDWMLLELDTAPETVRTASELELGTGQRPNAAISMRWADFTGDTMFVVDEKRGKRLEVFCPEDLRNYLSGIPKRGDFVLAKNLRQPLGYDAVEKAFRAWRATLGDSAREFVLHGLRKNSIIRLAEAGCSDAEIQAVTNQSAEMVAYYRSHANRLELSRSAQERRK